MNCDRCGKKLRGGPRFSFATLGFSERGSRAFGVSGRTWQNYMCHGVGREQAERIAERLGVHPYELWPELIDYDAGARPCKVCDGLFVPVRCDQVYCGAACRKRAQNQRRQERHGDRIRELQRAWREANADSYRKHHTRYMRVWRQRKRQDAA